MEENKSYLMWTEQSHFGHSKCSFQLEKESMWEYTFIYVTNIVGISYKGSKKIYGKYLILSQILERIDSPKNIENFVSG